MLKQLYQKWRIELWLILIGIVTMCTLYIVQQAILNAPGATNYVRFLGAPLDDVFIHLRFAQNLLHGAGFSFNPGTPLAADTSPLWVILLAGIGWIASHVGLPMDLEVIAMSMSILCYLLLAPGVYRIARDIFLVGETWSCVAGIITVVGSRMIWAAASGMEVSLAALLMLMVVGEHTRAIKRRTISLREAALLGLGYNVRPEFLYLLLLVAGDWIWLWYRERPSVKRISIASAIVLMLIAPYPLFSYLTNGTFVSHSSIVQGVHVSLVPNVVYLWFTLKIYASNNLLECSLLGIGSVVFIRKEKWRVPILLVIGLPIAQAFVAPQFRHNGRYFFPVIPVGAIIACAFGENLTHRFSREKWLSLMLIFLLFVGGGVEAARWIYKESYAARNINDQQIAIAKWVDATLTSKDTLAVDDVGALAYYTDRPIIDLVGLVSPKLFYLEHDQDSVWNEARQEGANVFVIFRTFNTPFYLNHRDSLILMQQFSVRLPLAASLDTTMSVYRVRTTYHAAR
jgi:hypothetical protein